MAKPKQRKHVPKNAPKKKQMIRQEDMTEIVDWDDQDDAVSQGSRISKVSAIRKKYQQGSMIMKAPQGGSIIIRAQSGIQKSQDTGRFGIITRQSGVGVGPLGMTGGAMKSQIIKGGRGSKINNQLMNRSMLQKRGQIFRPPMPDLSGLKLPPIDSFGRIPASVVVGIDANGNQYRQQQQRLPAVQQRNIMEDSYQQPILMQTQSQILPQHSTINRSALNLSNNMQHVLAELDRSVIQDDPVLVMQVQNLRNRVNQLQAMFRQSQQARTNQIRMIERQTNAAQTFAQQRHQLMTIIDELQQRLNQENMGAQQRQADANTLTRLNNELATLTNRFNTSQQQLTDATNNLTALTNQNNQLLVQLQARSRQVQQLAARVGDARLILRSKQLVNMARQLSWNDLQALDQRRLDQLVRVPLGYKAPIRKKMFRQLRNVQYDDRNVDMVEQNDVGFPINQQYFDPDYVGNLYANRTSPSINQLQMSIRSQPNMLTRFPHWVTQSFNRIKAAADNEGKWQALQNQDQQNRLINMFNNNAIISRNADGQLSGIIPQMYSKGVSKNQQRDLQRLDRANDMITSYLPKQQMQTLVHPIVAEIVNANQALQQVGIGPINSKSLPLYAGRWIDPISKRIKVLPRATQKSINPLSLPQKIAYTQAKILNNWNNFVGSIQQYERLMVKDATKYKSNQQALIKQRISSPRYQHQFMKALQDYTKLTLDMKLSKGGQDFWAAIGEVLKLELKRNLDQYQTAYQQYNSNYENKRYQDANANITRLTEIGDRIKQAIEQFLQTAYPQVPNEQSLARYRGIVAYAVTLIDRKYRSRKALLKRLSRILTVPLNLREDQIQNVEENLKKMNQWIDKQVDPRMGIADPLSTIQAITQAGNGSSTTVTKNTLRQLMGTDAYTRPANPYLYGRRYTAF